MNIRMRLASSAYAACDSTFLVKRHGVRALLRRFLVAHECFRNTLASDMSVADSNSNTNTPGDDSISLFLTRRSP
ncbi:MAG: hypothetical protein L0219_19520, partial [Phycisphaerales bacterium]|nr:hypothetical protein [Phycisphaerales bacterium]